MKYRLTVKGQVALATFLILLSFVATPLLIPRTELNAPTSLPEGNVTAVPTATQGAVKVEEPVTLDKSGLTASELEKISAVVYFDPDQWEMQGKEIKKISEMVALLVKNPELKLVVEGNINGVNGSGDTEFGKDLSKKRAEVVVQVLVGKGIEGSRITVKSNGSSDPVTTDPEKTWMNRRTHVYVDGFKGNTP